MKPSCGPEEAPIVVGNDGEEDVSVVESRVGLKRLDVCYECDKRPEMNRRRVNTLRCQINP